MLVLTSSITLILVGGILSVSIFRWSSGLSRKDMEFYMQSVQEQLAEKLLFMEEGGMLLKNNEEMREFLLLGWGEEEKIAGLLERNINLFSERNLVSGGSPVVQDIYIYSKTMRGVGTHFYPEAHSARKMKEWHLKNELLTYMNSDIRFFYQKNDDKLDCVFTIYDERLETLGYCAIIINMDSMRHMFSQLGKYGTYYWALETEDGRIVGGTGFPEKRKAVFQEKQGVTQYGRKKYCYSLQNNSFGLTSYILIPEEKIYMTVTPILRMAWVISLSMVLAVLFVIRRFARRLAAPMQNIVEKLNQFGTGDFDTSLGSYELEEFEQISRSFNDMTIKIKNLNRERYEIKLMAQESQIQYLQAQINPHFMFNILSIISIRAKMNKDEEVFQMVSAFAGLMQGKLFRKNEVEILLKEEIEIVGFYLLLQGERFKDMITYEILWESEELKECMIPRLCVEPLVENAMIHGLEPKGEEGHICVDIRKENNKILCIIVTDDGVGFDMEKVNLNDEAKSPRVGIMNIQRLVHNLYGDGYGLHIESRPGEGTRMELRLPCRKERIY